MRVFSVIANIYRIGLDAHAFEYVFETNTRPLGAAYGSLGPLIPAREGEKALASVTATFQGQLVSMGFKLSFQVLQRKGFLSLHRFTVDSQRPGFYVHFGRWIAVVTDKHFIGGRDGIVQ